jgi:hypothetical protein
LAPLQGDFRAEIRVTAVTIGCRKEAVVPLLAFGREGWPDAGGAFSPVPRGDMDLEGLENLTLLDG